MLRGPDVRRALHVSDNRVEGSALSSVDSNGVRRHDAERGTTNAHRLSANNDAQVVVLHAQLEEAAAIDGGRKSRRQLALGQSPMRVLSLQNETHWHVLQLVSLTSDHRVR